MATYPLHVSRNLHRNQQQVMRAWLYRTLHLVDLLLALLLATLTSLLWNTSFNFNVAILWVLCALLATRLK